MTVDTVAMTVALTLFTVFVWSGVVTAVDALARQARSRVDERRERLLLTLMIAPTIVGVAAAAWEGVAPAASFSFPNMDNFGVGGVVETVRDATAQTPAVDWMKWAAFLGVGVYLAGVGTFVTRLACQIARLRRIAVRAEPMDFDSDATVVITSEAVPPFAGLCGRIVVPGDLIRTLPPHQLSLIIDHEQAHVRRKDTVAFLALSFIDALFWVVPFIQQQTNRCRLTAEIACDSAVTQSAPHMREDYARTLVAVLTRTAGDAPPWAPTVFSMRNNGEYHVRIRQILTPTHKRGGLAVLVGLAALMAPLAMVQIAIAQSTSNRIPEFTVAPVEGQLMSAFGKLDHPITERPEFSDGIILSTPIGTPVFAPADGRVELIASHPEGYGDFVMLNHSGGYATCYGPLTAVELVKGDRVDAGQLIARVSTSNHSPVPHLFIEVQKDGEKLDPLSVLEIPNPNRNAAAQ